MSLHFILGRAGSGKTTFCQQAIRQELLKAPQGPPLIWLVPEQATFIHEMALLDRNELPGSSRGEVLSFQRLAHRYGNQERKTWLDSTGKTMLTAQCLEHCRENLRLFQVTAHHEGFIPMVLAAMEELQRYNLSPEALNRAAAFFLQEAPESTIARKLSDLSLIYQGYSTGVAEQYTDSERGLKDLAAYLPQQNRLVGAKIWLDGFASFTPIQLGVIDALLGVAADVFVALCLPPELAEQELSEENLFYELWHTRKQLLSLTKTKNIPLGQCYALSPGKRFQTPELAQIEAHFSGNGVMPEAGQPQGVQLLQAATKRGEIAWVGRRILELCRQEGYRFRDFSIILRNMADYDSLIQQIFAEMGIPVFLDSPRQVLFHPLVEFLRSALEVVSEGWQHNPVFRYLKSGLVPIERDAVNLLENYCLAYGVKEKDWRKKEAWHMAPRRLQVAEREEYLAHINRLRRQASDALLIFDAEMRATTDVTAQLTALQNLLQAVGAEQRLQKWRTDAQEAGRLAEAQEHDQVYQDVQDLLAQAASFLGKGQLTLTALTEILDSGFASLTARLIPPALDEVFVADLQRSRTPAVKVSFLIGVNERVFPAAITDDGFFTSTEREALKEVGWELAPSSRQRQLAEEYLVYIALSRSSEQLYISHALSGEQGENLLPSPVLRRLRRIFPDLRYQNIPRQPGLQNSEEYIGGRLDTLNQLARQLRQAADGMPIADCWWQAYDWFARQPKWQNQLTRLCRGVVWQPDEQPIDATLTSSLYGKKHVTSISRLEAFNRCPCRYFARYGLKLRPPRQFVLEKLDMGAFYHLLLSEASLWIQDAGYDWSALTAEQLDSVLEQVLEKVKEEEIMELLRSSSRYLYSLKQGVAIVKATLLAMSEQAKLGDFRPVAFEVGFGPKEKWPGWQLQLPDGETLILEGRIDRIDIAQENGETHQFWLRVVDFKSSNKDLLPEEIAHGISLQLPVYLKVALDNAQDFAEGAPKPAGMFYMTVQDKMKNEGSPYTGPGEIRLNGLPILEKNSVLLAERDLQGRAQTIPVSLKADGSFGAGKGIHLEECEKLTEEVAACIRQTVSRIQAGEVHAQPWQSSAGSACDYCDYASLCAMDRIKGGDHHE